VVNKVASRQSKLAAGHGDGAMMEIDPESIVDRILEYAEGSHVVGERAVAIPVPLL
jgi:hypothetical protein